MREFIRICGVVAALALATSVQAQECIDKDLAIAQLEAVGAKILGEAPARFAKSGFLYFTNKGHALALPIVGGCVVVDVIDLGAYVPEVGA